MAVHELKTWPTYWDAIERGEKLFEVRRNDRFFQRGDAVFLYRTAKDAQINGKLDRDVAGGLRVLKFTVGAVLQGGQFGIEPGYCVFSLLPYDCSAAAPSPHTPERAP